MKKPSGYRDEQMRILCRGFARRIAAGLAAWTVLFALWAAAIDAFAAPRVADAVSSLCPWVTLTKEEAGLDGVAWYESAAAQTRADTVVRYIASIADDPDAFAAAGEAARDLVQAASPAAASSDDSPHAPDGADGASDDGSGAAEAEQGALGDVQQLEPDPSASSDAADATTVPAFDEAALADAFAAMDASAKEALFEEACDALGLSPATLRVDVAWPSDQSRAAWNEVYYVDGHMDYRDLRLYDFVRSLALPAAVAAYLVGAAAVVWTAASWLMRRFGDLFDAVATLFSGNGDAIELPRELEPTARSLDDVRRRHDDAQRAALAAEQRKNELVAYLAHDIRTPLTSIVGYLTLLAEAPDMPEVQRERYARTALDRSYRLESMMEEFFEITRYNLSSIPIERCRFDAALLCRQVADEFYPSASARSIDIGVQAAGSTECFADAEKVSRVLNNLLKNAVAYADAGSTVAVRVRKEPCGPAPSSTKGANASRNDGAPAASGEAAMGPGGHDGRPVSDGASPATAPEAVASPRLFAAGQAASACGARGQASPDASLLVIDVENRGREISPEHLQAIFEKFYREDGARSARGGAGLGLAIAREIARAHGGDLTAESEAGRTVFTLRVPA